MEELREEVMQIIANELTKLFKDNDAYANMVQLDIELSVLKGQVQELTNRLNICENLLQK